MGEEARSASGEITVEPGDPGRPDETHMVSPPESDPVRALAIAGCAVTDVDANPDEAAGDENAADSALTDELRFSAEIKRVPDADTVVAAAATTAEEEEAEGEVLPAPSTE